MKAVRNIFVALLLSLPLSISADVLFVEDFNYDDFSTPLVNQSEWTNDHYNADIYYANAYVTGGLNFNGYAGCGIGNAMVLDGSTGSYRPEHAFPSVKSGTVYAAFMFQPTQCYKSGFFFTLRKVISDTDYEMTGRVSLELDEDYDAYFGFQYGKATQTYISDKLAEPDKVYLVVVKYEIKEGTNNDEASLFVFDEYPSSEPNEPLIGPITSSAIADIAPGVVLYRGLNESWLVVDGIRVATTWAEAVAPGICPAEDAVENVTANEDSSFVIYDILGKQLGSFEQMPQLPEGIYVVSSPAGKRKIYIGN